MKGSIGSITKPIIEIFIYMKISNSAFLHILIVHYFIHMPLAC